MILSILIYTISLLILYSEPTINSNPSPEIVREIGCSETDDMLFGWVKNVQLDHRGYSYIVDTGRAQYVTVLDQNGEYLTEIGKRGRGPGEFTGLTNIYVSTKFQTLTALDFRQSRITTFSIDDDSFGEVINELVFPNYQTDTPELLSPNSIVKLADENYLIHYIAPISPHTAKYPAYHRIIYMEKDSHDQKKLLKLQPDEKEIVVSGFGSTVDVYSWPYSGASKFAVDPNGKLFTGWSYDQNINIYNLTGEKSGSISIPATPLPMTTEDKNKLLKDYTSRLRRLLINNFHDVWPYYEQMAIDDNGMLWVGTLIEDMSTIWYGFDENGDPAEKFTLDNRDRITNIYGDRMAAIRRSHDMNTTCVVLYKKNNNE